MKVDLYDSLPLEKILIFHDIIILNKPFLNIDQNHYSFDIFLEKYLQLAKQ